MTKSYRVREFAELAGVTVKALHHYDRLGLLKSRRTATGYRLYHERDLERLQQIVTLKFLGLPLRQIKRVLDETPLALPDALARQRKILEERQHSLSRALEAIDEAQRALTPGQPADPTILRRLIEVIRMQDDVDLMKRYFDDQAWPKAQSKYQAGPSPEWRELFLDVRAALEEDPAGERAQTLATRFLDLTTNDPGFQAGAVKAWADRVNWPASLRERVADADLDKIASFIHQAIAAHRRKYYDAGAWSQLEARSPEDRQRSAAAWQSLFREANTMLEEDPACERAQSLVARWMALAGDDPAVRTGSAKAWAERDHWPEGIKRQVAAFNIEKVIEFLGQARAAHLVK